MAAEEFVGRRPVRAQRLAAFGDEGIGRAPHPGPEHRIAGRVAGIGDAVDGGFQRVQPLEQHVAIGALAAHGYGIKHAAEVALLAVHLVHQPDRGLLLLHEALGVRFDEAHGIERHQPGNEQQRQQESEPGNENGQKVLIRFVFVQH